MKIKIYPLRSCLSDASELDKIRDDYLLSIKDNGNLEFEMTEALCEPPYFFLIETGGTEELFIKLVDQIKGPCYLLTTGMNNSLAASIEIETYMRSLNKECLIIHGTAPMIVSKIHSILDDDSSKTLNHQQLGVVGKPSNWLIASMCNYDEILKKTGIHLIDITTKEFETEINKNQYDENSRMSELRHKWNNQEELNMAFAIYGALKRLVVKYNLNGLTVRCFDLLSKYKNTSCLALALLNDEGITATCEGDVPTMITMHLANIICKEKAFQVNPARIDVENNTMIFAHCTIPFSMVSSYELFTHFESNLGVAIRGKLDCADITVLRFNKDLSKMFLSLGTITANLSEERLCRTQIKVQLAKDVHYFLNNPCGNHHVVIYGNHASAIMEYCKKIGCLVL